MQTYYILKETGAVYTKEEVDYYVQHGWNDLSDFHVVTKGGN